MWTSAARKGVAHHGADVEVVLPVLDGDVERVTALVQIGDDGLAGPVAVSIHHVPAIALGQELRIEPLVLRPWSRPGPDAHFFHCHGRSRYVARQETQ
jgi:hypothetical protein